MHASAKTKPIAPFKPIATEQITVPRVAVAPVPAPSVSVPSFSIPAPAPKPVKFAKVRTLRSLVAANLESKARSLLRAENPADSGAPDGNVLERRVNGQSFPRLASELRIGGERRWQPSVLLGYGQPCDNESSFEASSMGPRREEPGSAYLRVILNF